MTSFFLDIGAGRSQGSSDEKLSRTSASSGGIERLFSVIPAPPPDAPQVAEEREESDWD